MFGDVTRKGSLAIYQYIFYRLSCGIGTTPGPGSTRVPSTMNRSADRITSCTITISYFVEVCHLRSFLSSSHQTFSTGLARDTSRNVFYLRIGEIVFREFGTGTHRTTGGSSTGGCLTHRTIPIGRIVTVKFISEKSVDTTHGHFVKESADGTKSVGRRCYTTTSRCCGRSVCSSTYCLAHICSVCGKSFSVGEGILYF